MPMPSAAIPVILDARMIRHSGIGVYLRGVLSGLAELQPPDIELTLLGDPDLVRGHLEPPLAGACRVVPFHAPIYSLREQIESALLLAKLRKELAGARGGTGTGTEAGTQARAAPVVHWPHYNFPLRWNGPLIVTVHDLIHTQLPPRAGTRLYQALLLLSLRRRLRRADRRRGPAAAAVTVSRHVKVLLQRQWRMPPQRVVIGGEGVTEVFRPPVDEEERRSGVESLRERFDLPRRYWLTVALYKPHKNLDMPLSWLGELWSAGEFPEVGLVMAGTGRPEALVDHARRDPALAAHVRVMPFLEPEDLRSAYWGAEALLFPSHIEGFGLPVLEAMRCATPVLCARRAPMTEFAREAAVFFDPESADEFRAGLGRLSDPRRDERIQRGLAAARGFTWKRVAERLVALWRQAAGAP